jgi:hypothetical protein
MRIESVLEREWKGSVLRAMRIRRDGGVKG